MAWFDENSVFSFGKYKSVKVSDINDSSYISWVHHSKYNIYFIQSVLDRREVIILAVHGKYAMVKRAGCIHYVCKTEEIDWED